MNRTTVGIGVDFHITCFQTISLLNLETAVERKKAV